jgi:serine/threonine protein kinase/tetratricopeptide (TPR) repeat protein
MIRMALTPGSRLGPYEILTPLGAGGMGEVYRARDPRLGRDVAIKVLPASFSQDADRLRRFEQEARAAGVLNHPNITAVYDVGTHDGAPYVVQELLEGETLRQELAGGRLPSRKATDYALQIAHGLAAAHEKGIVHRDLKPENLFVTKDGHLKILDFGLAKRVEAVDPGEETSASTVSGHTEPGTVMGTVGYMSPEQVRGLPSDARSDIFALGCVLFEIATGTRAFHGASPAETLADVLRRDPCEQMTASDEVPETFHRIVAHCLEKNPDDRFQSAKDLAFALRLVTDESRRIRTPHRRSPGESALPSLAVLPFVNRSPDPENEYFSDGMTEELISALSRVEGLRVASRTSVFAVKGRGQDIRELGRELGVTAVVEGSVRRAGDRLRITAELTGVVDGFHLWSDTYDRDIRDIFAVQDDISRRIVATLRDRLGIGGAVPESRKVGTDNVRAYELYLKGRFFWAKLTTESIKKAVEFFDEAIEADPGFARAHSGLADCFLGRGGFVPRIAIEKARAAALRALELDDSLPDAHTSLGRVHLFFDWDWKSAESELRRAIELDSRYAEGRHSYSHYLLPAGRVADSLLESRAALEIEPLSPRLIAHLGWHYLFSGDFVRAVEQCRVAIDLDPGYFYAHFYLGMAHEQRAEPRDARREFEEAIRLSPESSEAAAGWIHMQAAVGNRREAEEALAELSARASSEAYENAVAHAGLGNTDRALALLEQAIEDRSDRMVDTAIDPRLRPLHGNSRFREIVRRVGLPDLPSM